MLSLREPPGLWSPQDSGGPPPPVWTFGTLASGPVRGVWEFLGVYAGACRSGPVR